MFAMKLELGQAPFRCQMGPWVGSEAPRLPEERECVDLGTRVPTLILTENFQGSAPEVVPVTRPWPMASNGGIPETAWA